MTTDTEHTYGFYSIMLNRIQRDIDTNRVAHRLTNETQDTHTVLLRLIKKFSSNPKTANNINTIITHNQMASRHLDSQYSQLLSEFDSIRTYLQNNEDIAGTAYEMAYNDNTTPVRQTKSRFHRTPILKHIAKVLTQRTK